MRDVVRALRLGLLPDDESQLEPLGKLLLTSDPREFLLIRDALFAYRERLCASLWNKLVSRTSSRDVRLRAACCLAAYDPNGAGWQRVRADVADILVDENALLLGDWIDALRPAKRHLVPPLANICRSANDEATTRTIAATGALIEYTADDPKQAVEVIADAADESFQAILANLESHREQAIQLLTATLRQQPTALPSDSSDVAVTRRKVNMVMALYRLGHREYVWPLLDCGADPRVRRHLIHQLAASGLSPLPLLRQLDRENTTLIRRALLLSLGEFPEEAYEPEVFQRLVQRLLNLYRTAPDPGIHAAAEWTLRHWNCDMQLRPLDEQLAQTPRTAERHWFVNGQGQTMAIISGPVDIALEMDAPDAEGGVRVIPHTRRISRSFAIATKETTGAQFSRFLDDHPEVMQEYRKKFSALSDHPQEYLNWYQAAAYCRWLSEQEGIPEDQMCYPPFPQILEQMTMPGGLSASDGLPLADQCGMGIRLPGRRRRAF